MAQTGRRPGISQQVSILLFTGLQFDVSTPMVIALLNNTFQSYFLQDYNSMWLGIGSVLQVTDVSILLFTGLQFDAIEIGIIEAQFLLFQSYFLQDYNSMNDICASRISKLAFQSYFLQDYNSMYAAPGDWPGSGVVSILLFTGLQFDGSAPTPAGLTVRCFNPTFYRITIR